jgi:Tol biopolymer transport system component
MRLLTLAAAGLIGTLALTPLAAQSLDADLQRAAQKAVTTGDLRGAIQDYERIVSRAGGNHAVAAQALLRMAEAYRTFDDAQARTVYERIVRDYSDQATAVAEARARLGGAKAMAYSQVWAGPKVDVEGTVSADGRYLSFTNWDTGNLELHDFTTNTDRPLTSGGTFTNAAEYAEDSVISQDGSQVTYAWLGKDRRYELRAVPLQATGVPASRLLYNDPGVEWIAPYDWSPDGKWIAVSFDRTDQTRGFGLVPAEGGQLIVLKTTGQQHIGLLKFSPDGRFLAVDVKAGGDGISGTTLSLLSIPDGAETPLRAQGTTDKVMAWSPDGRWLLFLTDQRGTPDLWAMEVVNGHASGRTQLLKTDVGGWSVGITDSGALFVGTDMRERDIQIAPIDLASGNVGSAHAPIARFFGTNRQPDWSPDGTRLAYVSARPNGIVLGIRTLASGATDEHVLSLTNLEVPRWSPDGRFLIANGIDKSRNQGIFRIDATTGTVTVVSVAPNAGLADPQWHPDGRHIFYRRRVEGQRAGGTFAIVEHDLSSGATRELVRKVGLHALDIDRQGRTLVAAWTDRGSSVAGLVPIDGRPVRELARFDGDSRLQGRAASFTPDGTAVIVATRDAKGKAGEVFLLPLDGSVRKNLGIIAKNRGSGTAVRVSPDGKSVAYAAGGNRDEVWKLENFLPASADAK